MKKFSWSIRRILILCLCLVLLAGTACAEKLHFLSTGDWDYLGYGCTLPDGRIVLVGTRTVYLEDYMTGAWVLCLNPDRTVSWEAVEGDKNGAFSASEAAMLPDGTIGVVFDGYINEQNVVIVKTYTQDGQLTGKGFETPEGYLSIDASPSWVMLYRWDEEKETDETVLFDWDGKELLRYDGFGMPGAFGGPVGNTDELVLAGRDAMDNSHAKIMKLDGLTGRALWETTLDRQLPDTTDARIRRGIRTGDGDYIVVLTEGKRESETRQYAWNSFLAKFDAEGRVQRIDGESFARDSLDAYHVFSCGGKIGVYCCPQQSAGRDSFRPLVFRWFDEDCKEIGTTEVNLDLKDFPTIRHFLGWEPDETNPEPTASVEAVIPMADGLWALAICAVSTTDSEGIHGTVVDSNELVLIRIPELSE